MRVHADASVYAGTFGAGESAEHMVAKGRHAWVHVARGRVQVNGTDLGSGDAVGLSDESVVRVEGVEAGEVILFDLA